MKFNLFPTYCSVFSPLVLLNDYLVPLIYMLSTSLYLQQGLFSFDKHFCSSYRGEGTCLLIDGGK